MRAAGVKLITASRRRRGRVAAASRQERARAYPARQPGRRLPGRKTRQARAAAVVSTPTARRCGRRARPTTAPHDGAPNEGRALGRASAYRPARGRERRPQMDRAFGNGPLAAAVQCAATGGQAVGNSSTGWGRPATFRGKTACVRVSMLTLLHPMPPGGVEHTGWAEACGSDCPSLAREWVGDGGHGRRARQSRRRGLPRRPQGYSVGRHGRLVSNKEMPSRPTARSRPCRLNWLAGAEPAGPKGAAYWLVRPRRSRVLSGESAFFGSTGKRAAHQPIVGMAPTPAGTRGTGWSLSLVGISASPTRLSG